MRIGVLGLQGDFREHLAMLEQLGVEALDVRTAEALRTVNGLIIPGGESTTLSKLLNINGLTDTLVDRAKQGMPLFGTCAGAILMSTEVIEGDPQGLDLLDISISRNAYGRQVDSFEAMLEIEGIGPFCGVFIRAPRIKRCGADVKILAKHNEEAVLVQSGNMMAGTFHPELTDDAQVHDYFVELVRNWV